MMRVIYKYKLELMPGVQVVQMKAGAVTVHAGTQEGALYLWALVPVDSAPVNRQFRVVATGEPVELGKREWHICTVQTAGDVWHIFETRETRGVSWMKVPDKTE
jgi:hypothetical protein